MCAKKFSIIQNYNLIQIKSTATTLNAPTINRIENDRHDDVDVDVDYYCRKYGDWLALTNKTYFKKSTSYYFIDLNFVSLNFLKKIESNFSPTDVVGDEPTSLLNLDYEFLIHVNFNHSFNLKKTITIEQYKFHQVGADHFDHAYSSIQIDINFTNLIRENVSYFDESMYDYVKIDVFVFDIKLNESSQDPIRLKLKSSNFKQTKSKQILTCSKLLYIENDQLFADFKQWIELKRTIGYEKFVVNTPPGAKFSPDRVEYMRKSESFLEIRPMTCVPNLIDSKSLYLKSYVQTKRHYELMDTAAFLLMTDCYMDNMDKYQYIQVIDQDELIIPYKSDHISYGSAIFESFYNRSSSIQSLNDLLSTRNDHLFHVNMESFKLITNSVEHFMKTQKRQLENVRSVVFYQKYFLKHLHLSSFCTNLYANMSDVLNDDYYREVFVYASDAKIANSFRFVYGNRRELLYSIYLCETYERTIKPYLGKKYHMQTIFNRVFSLSQYASFKSMHNTNKVMIVQNHHACYNYEPLNNATSNIQLMPNDFLSYLNNASYFTYDHGHVSHFKKNPFFYLTNFSINIREATLDMSYLKFINSVF